MKTPRQLALDFCEGRRRKNVALTYAEGAAKEYLSRAREYARQHCRRFGRVTADDVVNNIPYPRDLNPNLRGALFRSKDFRRVGFALSTRAEAHCNILGVWELTES